MRLLEPDEVQVVENFDLNRVSEKTTQVSFSFAGEPFSGEADMKSYLSLPPHTQYMGAWYVYSRTDNWAEKGLRCSKESYVMKPDGTIASEYTAERDYPFLWKPFKMNMDAQVLDPMQPAKLRHAFKSGPPNYFIVATDYDNYAAVYSPISLLFGTIKLYHAWVLVRDRNGPANRELLQNAYTAIERCGISRDQLVKIKQDCTSS